MGEVLQFLLQSNILTPAFVIGTITFVIAVIGKIGTVIEPSPGMRIVLAVFGFLLMAFSLGGYFLSSRATPKGSKVPKQTPESASPSTVPPSSSTEAEQRSISRIRQVGKGENVIQTIGDHNKSSITQIEVTPDERENQ